MQHTNPFVFGVPVAGKAFADRESEKREIREALLAGQNVILLAPRRYGKSSLMKEVSATLPDEFTVLWLDVSEVATLKGFLERIIKETHAASKRQRLADFVKTTLPRFLSLFKIGLGDMSISIEAPVESDLETLTLEIFDLPEKVGKRLGRRIVVVFDEFQDLLLLGDDLDRKMRARIQHHQKTSYVFMGSRKSLIQKMFFDSRRPFYYIGKKMEINAIPAEEFKPFIQDRFKATGKHIEGSELERILQLTAGHPYFTQYLCFEIWNGTGRKVAAQDVEHALRQCILAQGYIYDTLRDQIRGKDQRSVLFYLATHGSKNLFGLQAMREMEITNPNSLNYALRKLIEMGVIEKSKKGDYRFVDPFFVSYLKQKVHI